MNPADLRIVFAGTPAFAAAHLEALLQAGLQVVSVYSQPDRPAGRGKKLQPTPVKAVAEAHHLPVCQPLSLQDESAFAELAAWRSEERRVGKECRVGWWTSHSDSIIGSEIEE